MILMRILPGVLKELSKHVPTVLFKVIDWSELSAELPKISRRMLQKEGYQELFDEQKKLLEPFNVILSEETLTPPKKMEKWVAEKWLEVYFAQLFSPHGIFLDLRHSHYQTEQPKMFWHPPSFWAKFEPTFHEGLLEIYDGFYLSDEPLYQQGLKKIGLVADDWSEEDKNKLAELFKGQFGSSIESEISFDLEHFKSSIIKITNFLLNKEVTITKDFLYLGIYLVTLYSGLEQSHEKLSVKKIYMDVKKQLSK